MLRSSQLRTNRSMAVPGTVMVASRAHPLTSSGTKVPTAQKRFPFGRQSHKRGPEERTSETINLRDDNLWCCRLLQGIVRNDPECRFLDCNAVEQAERIGREARAPFDPRPGAFLASIDHQFGKHDRAASTLRYGPALLAAKRHPDDGDHIENDRKHAQRARQRHAASPLSSQRLKVHPSVLLCTDLQRDSPLRTS